MLDNNQAQTDQVSEKLVVDSTSNISEQDEIVELIKTKNWQNINDVAKAYQLLEQENNNKINIPQDGDNMAWQDLYQKLGRPVTAKDYQFITDNNNIATDAALEEWFKQTAFNSGLSTKQAKELFVSWNNFVQTNQESSLKQRQQDAYNSITNLQKQWGADFNQNLSLAKQAVNYYQITPKELDAIEAALGSDNLIKLFEKIGSNLKESNFITSHQENNNFIPDKNNAKQQVTNLMKDKQFLAQYLNGDKQAIAKVKQLMQYAV